MAQDAFFAQVGKNTKRKMFYFCTTLPDDLEKEIIILANSLKRNLCVLNAMDYPELSQEHCYGVFKDVENKGIFLMPYLTANKNERVKNPLLLIKNFVVWEKACNRKSLLKLLDPEEKNFHSNYFDLEVDMAHLDVIGMDEVPANKFDGAVKSRLKIMTF